MEGIRGRLKFYIFENMKATKENHLLYNKNLQENARGLRHNMTKAEACLWKYALRAGHMKGHTFNRQRPILNYIADFACKDLKLIIEVDGYSHLLEETILKDKKKQDAFEKAGFIVLRFTDNEVLKHMSQVKQNIWDKIEELETNTSP